ncbi:helicase with zinc finger domain 2-like [Saccostrea echinata]|uniref:helicase with zinc finger domain 2-like n=1 Tax=Saccostrea echinata TaxID=191078 RepID=UPI002A7EF9C9|nr:helicase with zinc finger domain 2-like [Saccostrea echinata]
MAGVLKTLKVFFFGSDDSEEEEYNSDNEWVKDSNQSIIKQQKQAQDDKRARFQSEKQSRREEKLRTESRMPGKRKPRIRRTSWSQLSREDEALLDRDDEQNIHRVQSLQDISNNELPSQRRSFSSLFHPAHAQSSSNISVQFDTGNSASDSTSSDMEELESCSGYSESAEDEDFYVDEEEVNSSQPGRCFTIPKEDSEKSKFEDSCAYYENNENEEEDILQQDMMKYGLDLPECNEPSQTDKKQQKLYDEFLPVDQLEQILRSNTQRYKRCKVSIQGAHVAQCTNLDVRDELKEIEISGRSKAGKVFDGDIVLVEIFNYEKFTKTVIQRLQRDINKDNRSQKIYGKIIGVFERRKARDIDHPVFVCTLDDTAYYLMRPVCRTVPKLHVDHNRQKKYTLQVYKYDTKSSNIEPDSEFRIDPGRKSSFVFLVVYLSWSSLYPMGAVIDVIEIEESYSSAMKILRLHHQVPEYYQKETVEYTKKLINDIQGEASRIVSEEDREDLTHLRVFTIDPEGSQDIDDALSVEKVGDIFEIGVHIADVSLVVKKDDQIDGEAQERACTFYPGQGMNPYHMLPEPLSRDICSLRPGVMRPTLSVMFRMTKTGRIENQCIKKTKIKSCRKFSYEEVQQIIEKGSSSDNALEKDILQLFEIAKTIRTKRPGSGFHAFPVETKLNDNEDSILNSREAHYLVEEFMILSNTYVAAYLRSRFPKVIPLRCQAAPSLEILKKWKDQNYPFLHMVLRLQNVDPSAGMGGDKIDLNSLGPFRYTRIMPVQKWVWENIIDAVRNNDIQSAIQYLCTDELHPSQCLALEEWISFQESASYKCSGTLNDQREGMHFSLQRMMYVHFTSPIRRYPDIIVHRLLHAAIDNKKCPYSESEVDTLCQSLNDVIRRAKDFQKQCRMLTWGFRLKQCPQILQGFVHEVSDRSVSIVLPGLRSLPQICKEIELNLLHVYERPKFDKDTTTGDLIMTLNWLLRIYDVSGKPNRDERKAQRLHWLSDEARKEVCKRINPHARTKFVLQERWKEILLKVVRGEYHDLENSITVLQGKALYKDSNKPDCNKEVDEDLHNYVPACKDTLLDHSSEVEDGEVIRQACRFSMSLSRGQVVCVQITAEPQKGVLVPSLQLLDMSKNIKHCLQHSRDPIKFLSKYSIHKSKSKYPSVVAYLQIWLPIIEMEAVTNAAHDDSPIINGISVYMESCQMGYFILDHYFCEQRDIDFSAMSPHFILVGDDENKSELITNTDYLCIRSEHLTSKSNEERKTSSVDPNYRFQWVLHGQIGNIEKIMKPTPQKKDSLEVETREGDEKKRNVIDKYKIHFKLHKESNKASTEMMFSGNGFPSCVELVQKSETETRIEAVVNCLGKSSKLAKNIALQRVTPDLGETYLEKARNIQIEIDLPSIAASNVYQTQAIRNSLTKSFSLIHGPPGTGKTYTGIKLVYLFDMINDLLRADGHKHQQVVFCGPNNKSVDLVARWILNKFDDLAPDMVRLYGNSLENKDYPMPGKHYATSASAKENRPDPQLKDISVHRLIRQEGSLHATEIKDFDDKFKLFRTDKSYRPTIRDIRRYKHITSEAAQEELKKHDVIFCTTAVTTSPRFIKGTRGKVFQLIIDEAGMCTEPESIAAIIATKAKQVVLIGDHKQLSPVICSTHAAELGLEVSLFERYAIFAKMLRFQYRMHPAICEFPSTHFYDKKLITKKSSAWKTKTPLNIWIDKEKPIIFCHVEGEEEYLTVSTEEGNEQSCSNKQEVDHVVKVFEYLVKYEKINPSNKQAINIMSQYNAQCTRIRKALLEKKYININVNTVVASQGGEWDYVIFSTARSLPDYRIEKQPTLGWCKQNLGFITDKHQINVALTRARRGLIIIGNKHLLSCDFVWRSLIKHYARFGCVTDVEHFPPPPPVMKRRRRKSHRESLESEEDFYRGTDRQLSMVDEENE